MLLHKKGQTPMLLFRKKSITFIWKSGTKISTFGYYGLFGI